MTVLAKLRADLPSNEQFAARPRMIWDATTTLKTVFWASLIPATPPVYAKKLRLP
jgi:hypothetical protein